MRSIYFEWMCSQVATPRQIKQYSKLLDELDNTDFMYKNSYDSNRESDGIDLRYRFGYDTGRDQTEVAYYIDNRPCSLLEMMVALSIRMDDTVDFERNPGRWFWAMIRSLGLHTYDNMHYDTYAVNNIIVIFEECEYDPETGAGGLFILKNNHGAKLTEVEIWCQAMWHLTEVV